MIFAIGDSRGSISRIGDYLKRYITVNKAPAETFLKSITDKLYMQTASGGKTYVLLAINNLSVSVLRKVILTHAKIIAIKEDFTDNHDPLIDADSLYKQNLLMDNGALVVSVSLLFGTNFSNFAENIFDSINNNTGINVDGDLYVSPVLIDEVAEFLYKNLDKCGYMRFLSDMYISLYGFACDIAEKNGLDPSFINNAPTGYRTPGYKNTRDENAIILDYRTSIQKYTNQKKCLFNLIYKLKPYDYFENESIASIRYAIGEKFSATIFTDIVDDIDYIVPIPQAGITYANGIANALRKPLLYAIFQRSNTEETFFITDVFKRKCLIKKKLVIIREMVENKKIGLVDEAIFTGLTLKMASESLRAFGAEKIHILIPSPLGKNRCTNYVHPNRTVIGERKIPKISDYFSADTITFGEKYLFSKYSNYCGDCINEI